jgi:hypothetical protein
LIYSQPSIKDMELAMTKTSLSSLRAHPERERLFDYLPDAPEGAWIGRLDFLAWGKSQNILCYFMDEASGSKYRLSTFWNRNFASAEGRPVLPGGGTRESI